MDNYEKLLEEKIENARNQYQSSKACYVLDELTGEICALEDALVTYRNLKAKGEI